MPSTMPRARSRLTLLQLLWNSAPIVSAFNGTYKAHALNGGDVNPIESVLQQSPGSSSLSISPQPFTVTDSSGIQTITLGGNVPSTANLVPQQTNTGVQVVPIVLGGSTFVNTIPNSEFIPLPIPTMTALVVPYPPPGLSLSAPQVPNSIPKSSLPAAASSPGASNVPSTPTGSQASVTTPAATIRPSSAALESSVSSEPSQATASSAASSGASFASAPASSSSLPLSSSSPSSSSPSSSSLSPSTTSESTQVTSSEVRSMTTSGVSTEHTNSATSSSESSGTSSSAGSSSTSSPTSSISSNPASRTSGSLGPGSTIAPPNNGDSAAGRSLGSTGGSLGAWLAAAFCLGFRLIHPVQ